MTILKKYFNKRKKAINLLLKKPHHSFTPDTFHKLRVEIKKLVALCDIINACSKDFKKSKTLEPIKLIFDQAGKVRELYIEEKIIKKYFIPPLLKLYRQSLKEVRLKEQADFFSTIDKKIMEELKTMNREIVSYIDQLNKKEVYQYMKQERQEIKKHLGQDSIQVKEAHDLRKLLKKFNYNRESLKLENKFKPLPKENILPDLLGEWHDEEVTIRHLKKAMTNDKIDEK